MWNDRNINNIINVYNMTCNKQTNKMRNPRVRKGNTTYRKLTVIVHPR